MLQNIRKQVAASKRHISDDVSSAPRKSPKILREPFVAPAPARWRERYGNPERQLKLLLCGHNPSAHTWTSGFPYSNPSNLFWAILRETGLIPPTWTCQFADRMPSELGIGFTDVGLVGGSDANEYKATVMREWTSDFFDRLRSHVQRVKRTLGMLTTEDQCAPRIVAFTGKRQWQHLFVPPLKSCETGIQRHYPAGWPLPHSTEVWVLPSTSGRAAMKRLERIQPYSCLAERLRQLCETSPSVPRPENAVAETSSSE